MTQILEFKRITLAEEVDRFAIVCDAFEDDSTLLMPDALELCRASRRAWGRYYSKTFSHSKTFISPHKPRLTQLLGKSLKLLRNSLHLRADNPDYEKLIRHVELRFIWIEVLDTDDGAEHVEESMADAVTNNGRFDKII